MGRRIGKSEKAIFKSDYIRNLVGRRDGFRIAKSSSRFDIFCNFFQAISCFTESQVYEASHDNHKRNI